MKAIIVDDEAQSHEVLRRLLAKDHPTVEVIASAFRVQEGLELIPEYQPDLVFLDIELPDGTGFDLLKQIGHPEFQVIFITAFEKYARTAIRFGALDYLLKPITSDDLTEALRRVAEKVKEKISHQQMQILWETLKNLQEQKLPTRLGISTSEGILYKRVEDIIRLEAHQNYTKFFMVGELKSILASVNLGEYEEQFELYREFMRVHRSHLVNLNYVDRYVRADGGYLVMQDGSKVAVSRLYRDELLGRLGQL